MNNKFINVQTGRNTHPRYILSLIITVIIFTMSISAFVYFGILYGIKVYDDALVNETEWLIKNPILSLYVDLFITIFPILGCWFTVKFILKRKFISLITPHERINWKRIYFGFSTFFVLIALLQVINMIFYFDDFTFNITDWETYAWLVLASLILVPIQTTSEELVFRGLLLQWIAKFTKNPIILAIIVGAIFGSLHFANPEMSDGWIIALDYLFGGFILTYITAKTNSSEFAIGAHAANNMFLSLFITSGNNAFGGIPSMFLLDNMNPYLTTFEDILIYVVFCFVVFKKMENS